MHEFIINKRKYEVASSWDEVRGDEQVKIAEVLHSPLEKKEALIRIFLILADVRKHFWLRIDLLFRLPKEAKYDLMRLVEWTLVQDYDCTEQKLPVIRSRGLIGHKLYGPLRECRRFVFIEFIEADTAYLEFRKNFDNAIVRKQALDLLVVILYRDRNPETPHLTGTSLFTARKSGYQATWNGDPRCVYNSNTNEYRVKEIRRLPDGYKYAILMFYHACHMQWEKQYTNIFKRVKQEPESGTEETAGGNPWAGALKSLAGGAINIEKMMEVNASAALSDLDDRIAEQERMERELEAKKIRNR